MLDEFSATKITKPDKQPKNVAHASSVPLEKSKASDEATNDFNKQLQEQMAALMGNVDETPEMKREIEAMLLDLGAAGGPAQPGEKSPSSHVKASKGESSSTNEEPFQESIRKTMERMQASGDQATAAAQSENSEDFLAQMMNEMQKSGLENAGDDEGFNKMLMGMMEQLTNKDILYEPMKELHEKFPSWMAKNKDSTGKDDLKRYEEQQRLVAEIVDKFEQSTYSDTKTADREFIVERMQMV